MATEDVASFPCAASDIVRLVSNVMTAPTLMLLEDHGRLEVQQQLENLCRQTCVVRFLAYYFNIWHRNCRIVHRASFGLDVCHETLALAVIFLGAMYSPRSMERLAASAIIEHVESYIFSCLPLASPPPEDDSHRESPGDASNDEQTAQVVQAAFLMVITLFWTGSEAQKRRAATELFDVVVQVCALRLFLVLGSI